MSLFTLVFGASVVILLGLSGCKHAQSSKEDAVQPSAKSAPAALVASPGVVAVPLAVSPVALAKPAALSPSLDTLDLDESELAIVREVVSEQFDPCGKARSFLQSLQAQDCALADRLARFVVLGVQKGYGKRRMTGMLLRELKRLNTVVDVPPGAAPRLGPVDAKIAVLVFSDFQCGYCRRVAEPIKRLQSHYRIALYYKFFPLRNHSLSEPAARAAWAAQRQGKFWEMHDQLFEHNDKLLWESVQGYAKEIGLDLQKFKADVESDAAKAAVQRDYKQGIEVGVDGTPTFFVNGHRAESVGQVEDAIREQLKRNKATSIPARLTFSQGEGEAGAGASKRAKAEGAR